MSFFGEIYADPDLPHRARAVYMYLRDRAGGGSCWPGVKTIARDLHLSPRTVQRALNDLEHAGYIQRQRRHRENGSCTSNLYIINADAPRQGERPHFCCHQRRDTTAQLEGPTLAEGKHRKEIKTMQELR